MAQDAMIQVINHCSTSDIDLLLSYSMSPQSELVQLRQFSLRGSTYVETERDHYRCCPSLNYITGIFFLGVQGGYVNN
jgi:hypothetical protein